MRFVMVSARMAVVMYVVQGQRTQTFCLLAVVDYDAVRVAAVQAATAKQKTVREYVTKLGKAQRAAEETLEM